MLTLTNVQKAFHHNTSNELQLFNGFQLHIKEKEFVVVVGSNGSGKSTLLNLVDGNLPLDSGDIVFMQESIGKKPAYIRSKHISRVYQDPSKGTSPSLTIYENMSLALTKGKRFDFTPGVSASNKEKIIELLKLLDLDLEKKLDYKVSLLSGGQRQALSLLMAICSRPKLLLLDEHTAALDPKASDHIMKLTQKLVEEFEITAIMITHQLKDALLYGDRCIMLHQGKIAMDVRGEEKKALKPMDLISMFHELAM